MQALGRISIVGDDGDGGGVRRPWLLGAKLGKTIEREGEKKKDIYIYQERAHS